MLRISLTYISLILILSIFFAFMTLNRPNYFKQFGDDEKIKIISKSTATHLKIK